MVILHDHAISRDIPGGFYLLECEKENNVATKPGLLACFAGISLLSPVAK